LFVAGFIGSPSMNFLPGEIEGDSVKLPIGTVPLREELRGKAQPGQHVIAGLRPEHFEDAAVVGDRSAGITFKAHIDVLESMGSEYYAYFELEGERVSSAELEELARDTGAADLPSSDASQIVARLDVASKARQGEEAELWFDARQLQLFDAESGQNLAKGTAGQQAPAAAAAPMG
jgi:multiple sugar transport system ATP-binding protein